MTILEGVQITVEIGVPVIAIITWFIRLETKVAWHTKQLDFHDNKFTLTDEQAKIDRELIQNMALNVQEIKTNLEWVMPLLKEKVNQ